MRDDPYRRPAEKPVEKPRGIVVSRPDEPEDLEAADERRRKARYRAQSIVAEAELEEARRALDRKTRLSGLAAIAIGVLLSALTVSSLADGHYHARTVALAPAAILAGAWALVVGAGGAATTDSMPLLVKAGGVVAFAIGLAWGATGYVELLAMFVE